MRAVVITGFVSPIDVYAVRAASPSRPGRSTAPRAAAQRSVRPAPSRRHTVDLGRDRMDVTRDGR
jgi:hypothetical protein